MGSEISDGAEIHFTAIQTEPTVWVETHLSQGLELSRNMMTWRQRWAVVFDHLQCTDCQRLQNIWLADEPFKHDLSCSFSDEKRQHPWHDLAGILSELPSPKKLSEDDV
ncbi:MULTISPECIES: hypothetical protein [unclassified Pseudomonas]|uniref:hypothetical protein n=1 Tax=unclassified Pseudomonas TaxID=196821 RepID=UPI002AC9ADFB|nr:MULTISPECIES: hypothetical protein [unclassified Pseudomonas]MEB0040154.1 hypothetical protein [Pseudomonas sp. MH10]MEB0122507.1 hypothetical protein [Pseudomonas sp. CCI1.2]WPX65488.1 hypothetical protein RHM59_07550 [Pseudomonas sp. MH10]